MFMFCSNLSTVQPTSSRKEWVEQKQRAPTLDVRDVEDKHSHRQNSSYPDESRVRRFIHGDSCTYKPCAKTPHWRLNFRIAGSAMINFP
jgi:hypothetical protein